MLDLGVAPERAFFWFNQNNNINTNTGCRIVDPVKQKWFRNQKFRQAVSYAIDRESIVKALFSGRAIPNYGFETAANAKWQNTNVMQYPYNLDTARALLAEIGIKDHDADGYLKDADGQYHRIRFQHQHRQRPPGKDRPDDPGRFEATRVQGQLPAGGIQLAWFKELMFPTIMIACCSASPGPVTRSTA